ANATKCSGGALDSSDSGCALVRDDPLARGALRRRDLRRGHLRGDLPAQPDGILVAAHGREVEPLVRSDEIDGDRSPGRAVDAELEKRAARVLARPGAFEDTAWITLHVDLPSRSGCRDSECVLHNAGSDGPPMSWLTPAFAFANLLSCGHNSYFFAGTPSGCIRLNAVFTATNGRFAVAGGEG